MEWWIWVVIALGVVAVCAVSALGIQARRRGGGVIAGKRPPRGGGDRTGS